MRRSNLRVASWGLLRLFEARNDSFILGQIQDRRRDAAHEAVCVHVGGFHRLGFDAQLRGNQAHPLRQRGGVRRRQIGGRRALSSKTLSGVEGDRRRGLRGVRQEPRLARKRFDRFTQARRIPGERVEVVQGIGHDWPFKEFRETPYLIRLLS